MWLDPSGEAKGDQVGTNKTTKAIGGMPKEDTKKVPQKVTMDIGKNTMQEPERIEEDEPDIEETE